MRVIKVISIVICMLLSRDCYSQDYDKIDCNRIDTISLFNIQKLKHKQKNGAILSDVIDTIESTAIYNNFVWRIIEYIDTSDKQIYFQLLLDQEYLCRDYSIKERNIFMIVLSRSDSVYVEGDFVEDIDEIDAQLNEFLTNPENKWNLPTKKKVYINYFDTVLIAKHGIFINAVMIGDSTGAKSSWGKLNPLISKVIKGYFTLRDELAIKKWDTSFNNLDFNQKVAITQYYPINVLLFLNRNRLIPPPPPPPLPDKETEEFVIDSITNSLFERNLK